MEYEHNRFLFHANEPLAGAAEGELEHQAQAQAAVVLEPLEARSQAPNPGRRDGQVGLEQVIPPREQIAEVTSVFASPSGMMDAMKVRRGPF